MIKFNKVKISLLVLNLTIILLLANIINLKEKPGSNFVAATLGDVCKFTPEFQDEKIWVYDPGIVPPPQANIYTKDVKVWVLQCGNYLVPAKVHIEIW